jgi:hypothetical protein
MYSAKDSPVQEMCKIYGKQKAASFVSPWRREIQADAERFGVKGLEDIQGC